MICPNYKIKEVFDGFNEVIEALGGKPMTEEEFRSSELRNLRTGRDYSAMEAAYKMYHRNNGNMPDVAPNGEHSILFDSLLEYFNGDRKAAIKTKSNVYSDEFFKWFGNWIIPATPELAEDENISSGEVSKVVDENGEPLVVWHGSHNKFDTFDGSIFFFSSNKEYAFRYGSNTVYNFKKVKERLDILDRRQDILIKRIENQPYLKYASEHPFEPVPLDLLELYDIWKKTEYERIKRLNKIISAELRTLQRYSTEDAYNGFGRDYYFDRVEDKMYPVYLNIKEDITVLVAKESADIYNSEERRAEEDPDYDNLYMDYSLHFNPYTYTGVPTEENYLSLHKDIYFNIDGDLIKNTSGLIGKDINTSHTGYEYAVFNPNQIKHIENLGEFSTEDDNIYHHINEDEVLHDIQDYIKDYIKNLFGYGHSYNEIKKKVLELEKQLGVLEVKVMKNKKLNFDNMHFNGSPVSRKEEISRILGTDIYNSVLVLVNNINRLFPKLKIKVKEDYGLTPGSAFYDRNTNTIHYSPIQSGNFKSVNRQDIVEECLHPLIACIAATDRELFDKLLQQAKKDKGLVSYINQAYKNKSKNIIEQEIVTLAIAKMYANNTYGNLLSLDEFQRKEHTRRFNRIVSTIREWVNKIKSLIVGDKLLVKNSDFSTVISSLDSIVDILNTKDIEFTEVNNYYMTDNMWHVSSPDKVRKSAEDIRHRFGVLYKTYEKMPNKSPRRQQLANEIFEVYGLIKRLDNFDAVTKAMDFAEEKLGTKDGATNGVLQWLERNEIDNFAKVSAEQIVDVMQNSIGFFEDLLTYFPSDSFMSDEAQEQRNRISGKIQHTLKPLWSKAVYAISDRIVDELVDRWFTGLDEDKEGMKEVAKDWLHKNAMYGDINSMAAFVQNYQYSKNPITKLVFHLIQVADTKTGMELHPISAKISKAYAKANKDFGKLNPAWLKIFMEFDKDGIPTGNFVRDINYGQYQKDIDEFITNLNSEFLKKYGHSYYIDEDGTYINTLTGGFADDEEWVGNTPPHIIEYKLKIEEFKCKRANRRYTFEYYKERMSEPYDGPDPALTNLTGNFKHGLSPRTLSKYNRILSNINYYMSLCYDKETGVSHPENLSDSDWAKLESFRKELETLSNPYNEDGTVKSGEDYKTAIEIRAWEKWIGEKLDTQVDIDQFEREAQEILSTKGPVAYDRFIKYNSKIGINPNLISQTLKMFGASDAYAEAIHARLLKSSLQRLVSTKDGYTRDLSVQENNPLFWQECKKTDLLIEDYGVSRGKDFALMMENTFSNDLIEYRDTYGNAYDLNGNIVPRDKEKDTQLMTWYDHMINEYTSKIIASPSRTIEGLYDRSTGGLYVFSGNDNDVRRQVESLFTYRRVRHNSDGTSSIVREPLTIFSLLTPLHDTFVNHKTGKTEKSITNIPSGRFSTKTDKMRMYLTDPSEYDYNSHISEQPKREYYDNTEAFEKVKGSAKDLYDVLIEVCTNTQLLYKQSGSPFNYRLPMINAQSMALLSRLKSDGYKNISRAIWDSITTIEENDENMRTSSLFATNPDGTVATDIPLKFVRPLKDMRRLSTDISSMVVLFAEMGLNYKNKLKIDSSVKALRYNMDPAVRNMQERLFDDKIPSGDNEHSVDLFDNMTNIHLYGNDWHFKKKSADTYNGAIIAGQKIARFVQRYETTHMLGLNILSMLVGACDAGVKQLREVINGKYARPEDLVKGLVRCIIHTPAAIANIGCPLANNKFTALMLIFRISKGTRATYEHMNWSRIKKVAAQFLMGGFSMLDYMMNGLLLMSHMSNVRLYNEDGHDSEIPTGFYTLYELQQQFVKVGRKKSLATLTHLFLKTDLYNAFDFNSEEGICYVKDKYKNYVTDDIATQIRTKTLSRGALYNGMNPDNDQPKARKKVWSSMVLAMRGWLTQAYQHLMSGGTDNIPVTKKANAELLTRYGVTRLIPSIGREAMTNEQRARRQSWNYETGTPLDLIMVGIARSFGTIWRYLITNAFRNIPEGDPRKVKFSYVEKYAWKDALVYFAVLGFMLGTFPLVNNAAGELPPPDESDPKLLDDPYAYIVDVYIPNEYWKLQLADIYFRTIESSISSVDPTTAVDFITSLSVLKSGFDELWGLVRAGADYMGLSDHSLDEIVDGGGYRYYSRGMRAFAKGLGFLDNIHTAFDFYGLDSNLSFYLGKYGGLYRFIGYDYKRRYGRLNIGASTPSLSPGLESGPGLEGGPGAESGPGLDSGPGL